MLPMICVSVIALQQSLTLSCDGQQYLFFNNVVDSLLFNYVSLRSQVVYLKQPKLGLTQKLIVLLVRKR